MTNAVLQAQTEGSGLEASAGAGQQSAPEQLVPEAVQKWATRLLFIYFGVRLLFFALSISSFVPPDEVTHAGLCKSFSRAFLMPENGPDTYQFGLVTNIPWLYYWSMGKLLHLNVVGLPDLVFLRLLNIPLAFGTVWYALRMLRLLSADPLPRLLLLVAITNTSMFSLLSAAVSSDNLTNLLAAMATYYTLAYLKQRSGSLLAASLLCQLAGCLTKVTFLPLVLILDLLLVVGVVCNWRASLAGFKEYFSGLGRNRWQALQLLLILVALGLNVKHYAGNLMHYDSVAPSVRNVLPADKVMQYRIGARETIFADYQSGKITYMDALVMAGEIAHPGDKADTFYLLMNYENLKANPALWMGPAAYGKAWLEGMMVTIFGIKGHLPMYKGFAYLVPIYLVMALSLIGMLLRWRPRESGWLAASLVVVVLFYLWFLLFKINYPAYEYYGNIGITLQGRYLFLALAAIYVLASLYLVRLFRAGSARLALATGVALLFLVYDFPWFLAHATPEWYAWLPK
jgi:hypothetical protein